MHVQNISYNNTKQQKKMYKYFIMRAALGKQCFAQTTNLKMHLLSNNSEFYRILLTHFSVCHKSD